MAGPGVEGVVLYIGGGEAAHSAELLRMSNYFHFRGQEGWLNATAGAATELSTPGTGVSIMPGPFLINSRFPGGALQSYMGRIMTAVDVPTTNVPPGDPRSDLVVMNIEDPYPSDGTFWPFPGEEGSESRRTGPYARIRVIDNVPSNTLTIDDLPTNRPERGWTCIAIARLDRPANTGTVTATMIKNLRAIINPWAGIVLPDEILNNLDDLNDAVSEIGDEISGLKNQKIPVPAFWSGGGQCVVGTSANTVFATDNQWKPWPQEGISNTLIPPWCNAIAFSVEIIGAQFQTGSSSAGVDGNVYIGYRWRCGSVYSTVTYVELVEPNDVYYANCPDKRATRPPILTNIRAVGEFYVAPSEIGKRVTCELQVARFAGNGSRLYNGVLKALPGVTSFYYVLQYKEQPKSPYVA